MLVKLFFKVTDWKILPGSVTLKQFTRMCDEGQNLSDESDWWVAHGVGVADVGLDDIFEGFLNSLQNQNERNI